MLLLLVLKLNLLAQFTQTNTRFNRPQRFGPAPNCCLSTSCNSVAACGVCQKRSLCGRESRRQGEQKKVVSRAGTELEVRSIESNRINGKWPIALKSVAQSVNSSARSLGGRQSERGRFCQRQSEQRWSKVKLNDHDYWRDRCQNWWCCCLFCWVCRL